MKKVSMSLSIALAVSVFGATSLPLPVKGSVTGTPPRIIKLPICPTGGSKSCPPMNV